MCFNQAMASQKENDHSVVKLALIFLAIISLLLTAKFLLPRALVYLTQAARSSKISLANSYVFAAPLVVAADGQSKIRVNVFVLNDEGLGVADKRVDLSLRPKIPGGKNAQVRVLQPVTDKYGKAVFEVASTVPGQFVASASVGGVALPQTVTLTFRQF